MVVSSKLSSNDGVAERSKSSVACGYTVLRLPLGTQLTKCPTANTERSATDVPFELGDDRDGYGMSFQFAPDD